MAKSRVWLLLILLALPALAKEPSLTTQDKKTEPAPSNGGIDFSHSSGPLDVTADQGIELSQDAKEVIARVNAKAVRGNSTVIGDVLTAFYRPKNPANSPTHSPAANQAPPPVAAPAAPSKPGDPPAAAPVETSSNEVWRVIADGHVEIFTPTQHAYGDHADYNIDDAVVVLTGDHLKFTTPQDVVTARDDLEYWENRHQAVAHGNAVAVHAEKRIQADTLVADFAENAQKKMEINVVHGYDHVLLTTATDVVTGDRADYVVETGIVTVTGSVKMTRQNNQLNGGYAVVNLNTGISTLYPAPPGGKAADRQVRGLFIPQKKASKPGDSTTPKAP